MFENPFFQISSKAENASLYKIVNCTKNCFLNFFFFLYNIKMQFLQFCQNNNRIQIEVGTYENSSSHIHSRRTQITNWKYETGNEVKLMKLLGKWKNLQVSSSVFSFGFFTGKMLPTRDFLPLMLLAAGWDLRIRNNTPNTIT